MIYEINGSFLLFYWVLSVQNRLDRSGWKLRWLPCSVQYPKFKAFWKCLALAVQNVIKWKAFWKCLPLADSETMCHDGAIHRSLLKKDIRILALFLIVFLLLSISFLAHQAFLDDGSDQCAVLFVNIASCKSS